MLGDRGWATHITFTVLVPLRWVTRPIAPLFVLVLVAGGSRRWWILPCLALLPALVDLRIGAEMHAQAMGVLRLLTGG